MKELMQKPTLLTRPDISVVQILNEKLKATSPERTVDYIEYSDTYIENQLQQIKQAKEELKMIEANLKSDRERIKEGASVWLSEMGIDKLDGLRVSSITTYTPAPTKKLVIHDRECIFLRDKEFIKTSLDETKVKKFLENTDVDYSEFVELEITNKQPMIKINKRKS